jgi:hypothetical protein
MLLREFNDLKSHIEEGAKKISYRTTNVNIQKDDFQLKLLQSVGNYDLYFSGTGHLFQSVHFDDYNKAHIIYGYDRSNNLVSAIEVSPENNEFQELSEFIYDDLGRLASEICRTPQGKNEPLHSFYYIHKFIGNKDIISVFNSEEDAAEYEMQHSYDKNHNLIEMKGFSRSHKIDGWTKFQFNEQGNLIRQRHLDNHGHIYKTLNFRPPYLKGTGAQFTCITNKETYTVDHQYTFNEKGHWIQKVFLLNDEITTFCTREIVYY